ncbi:MAG: hypothetical protein A2145_02880 [candidate division Zixibacteria bacterium RBG_16_40_9]|nr:MAG: hypothetical protein A2145_02880 [candidate division Zixibacteria bacterium RBG_16_40_9]
MKKISIVLLFLIFVSLSFAQDPGNPDTMWVEIGNPNIPSGGADVIFTIRFSTDNTGAGNDITGFAVPLSITNSNPSANPLLDSTVSSTFSTTAVGSFSFLSTAVPTNGGNPSIFPLQYVLGAVSFSSGITSGTYTFAFVKINLSDTTTLCIDTMTYQAQALEFNTFSVAIYTPEWENLCSQINIDSDPAGQDSLRIEVGNNAIPVKTGGDSKFIINLYTDNTGAGNGVAAFSVPLYITSSNPSANAVLDTTVSNAYQGTAVSGFDVLTTFVDGNGGDPSIFPLKYILEAVSFGSGLFSNKHTFAKISIHLEDTTTLCIDTMTIGATDLHVTTSNSISYTPSWKKLCGQWTFLQNPNVMQFTAFSPVNLVVIDPKNDSIGIDFNTILGGSTYDTTQDVNNDGEKDDVVKIPNPYVGDYEIKVIPVDTGHFSLGIRIDGNDQVFLASNVVIADTDTTFSYEAPVFVTLRGDVNKDTKRSLPDIIYLVNYIFKGGPAPDPLALGNVNCDKKANGTENVNLPDIIYMVNFVFKGGPPPCS